MANILTGPDKEALIKLHGYDLAVSNLTKLFGWTAKKVNGKFVRIAPKYNTMDHVHLDAGEYINIEAVDTTVGSILWNKLFVEGTVEEFIPNHFFDGEVTNSHFKKFLGYIEKALRSNEINIETQLIPFLKNYEFYSMKLVTVFSPSYTQQLFQTSPGLKKKKKELLDNMKERTLDNMVKTEDALVDYAKSELKGNPGMTLFDSGARGSFGNDYKNINIMIGAVKNEATNEYDFITHGYLEGLKKEDLIAMGNLNVNASYPKAVKWCTAANA